MAALLTDILPIVLLIIGMWGIKPVNLKTEMNPDYLSISTGNAYRGFFALVVVLHHLAKETETGLVYPYFAKIGYLAVAVFFFLSGYGLQKSYISSDDYKRSFLQKRLTGILIAYAAATCMYSLLAFVGGTRYSLTDVLMAIVKGKPIVSNSWYIICIILFYLVFYALMHICKKNYKAMVLGACCWCMVYTFLCMALGYGQWWYNTCPIFVVGMFWATYESKILRIISKYYWSIATCVCLTLVALLFLFDKVVMFASFVGFSTFMRTITATVFVVAVLLFSAKFVIGNRVLSFLGKISLEIYLIHGLFLPTLRSGSIYIENDLLWCISCLVGTIVTAYLANCVFKKIKSWIIPK